VSEDHGLYVVEAEAEAAEVLRKALLEPGKAGVDRRQPTAILDQVPVDERVGEPVNAGDDVGSRCDGRCILFRRGYRPPRARGGRALS
jgi:hypothetical protein